MPHRDRFYPEARFGGFTDIDGTVAFFNRVRALLNPSSVILDVGCGRGAYGYDPVPLRRSLRILKGAAARIIGIDVDPAAEGNPFVDEFRLIEGDAWAVTSDSIDLVLCDNVLEHVPTPDRFFGEVRRVLKNDGYLCIRTPNRWSYVGLAARLLPNRLHPRITAVAQHGRKEEDVFPTFYKCNSARSLKKMMKKTGFECVVYGYDAEPTYLSFSRIAYGIGVAHQRFAPGFFKPTLFAFGKLKKDAA